MMRNRPEFHVADVAVLLLGATPISIYNSSAPEQVAYLIGHCGARVAIVEDGAFLTRLLEVRDALPTSVEEIVVVDPVHDGATATGAVRAWADLLASEPVDLEAAATVAQPEDLATVIYTSGTTGPPKGVMLDHANVCWTVESLRRAFGGHRPDRSPAGVVPADGAHRRAHDVALPGDRLRLRGDDLSRGGDRRRLPPRGPSATRVRACRGSGRRSTPACRRSPPRTRRARPTSATRSKSAPRWPTCRARGEAPGPDLAARFGARRGDGARSGAGASRSRPRASRRSAARLRSRSRSSSSSAPSGSSCRRSTAFPRRRAR